MRSTLVLAARAAGREVREARRAREVAARPASWRMPVMLQCQHLSLCHQPRPAPTGLLPVLKVRIGFYRFLKYFHYL